MNVGTTPVELGTSAVLIQNLGPDGLFVGHSAQVVDLGVYISVDESVVVGEGNVPLRVASEGSSDVRVLSRGLGIYPVHAPATP